MQPPDNSSLLAAAVRDGRMATTDGRTVHRLPEGCSVQELPCHPDDRGVVCELFDPRWPWLEEPFAFSYFWTLKPRTVKGWAVHLEHCDRYCIVLGEVKAVLYDARPESATFGRVFEVFLSDRRRRMLRIAPGVWHADLNLGSTEALIVNFPTIPYDHGNPDKYRLPVHNDLIPYQVPPELNGY